jgi:hypothetical protein
VREFASANKISAFSLESVTAGACLRAADKINSSSRESLDASSFPGEMYVRGRGSFFSGKVSRRREAWATALRLSPQRRYLF